ncbi:transmembrane protein 223 [Cylas formicarius]|uniref:transmembrane protein 223 n=1 Tax=Cylas formicarius TaxID=197179 RepID=UPI002958DB88|nr:transmembrane protein 223 [Cylas formicarius]
MNKVLRFCKSFNPFVTRPPISYCRWSNLSSRAPSLNINTKVSRDVILYKYENDKFYKIMNIFGLCQFGFWSYLSVFALKNMRDAPVDESREDLPWWRKINLGENKYRNGLGTIAFVIGWGTLAITWIFTLRSVKYLILRKGGDQLSIVTYTPLGKNRILTLGIDNVSAKETREAAKAVVPIKVRGHAFHYMVDMKGEFKQPELFDSTAGLNRLWSK